MNTELLGGYEDSNFDGSKAERPLAPNPTESAEIPDAKDEVEIPKHINGAPVKIDTQHIARHLEGSGVLGASITAWENVEQMIEDPRVRKGINAALDSMPKGAKKHMYRTSLDSYIGTESITRLSDLPPDISVEKENREGTTVNVVDLEPPPTDTLNIRIIKKKGNPGPVVVRSMWCGSVESPGKGITDPEWENFAFYKSVR